jgi:hypothetical protein
VPCVTGFSVRTLSTTTHLYQVQRRSSAIVHLRLFDLVLISLPNKTCLLFLFKKRLLTIVFSFFPFRFHSGIDRILLYDCIAPFVCVCASLNNNRVTTKAGKVPGISTRNKEFCRFSFNRNFFFFHHWKRKKKLPDEYVKERSDNNGTMRPGLSFLIFD